MKLIKGLFLFTVMAAGILVACNKVNYKKAKSGMLYQIYPGGGKDSLIRDQQYAKLEMVAKLGDSVLYSSYGKMPLFVKAMTDKGGEYSIIEILTQLRKGDSVVTVQLVDSLQKRGAQMPDVAKKGDLINTSFKVIEVYANDSLAMTDYNNAMERDRPRQMKEQEAEMEKMAQKRLDDMQREDSELEKSGEMARQIEVITNYLKSKNINAQKTGKGTFVKINQQGAGPQAADGKYVNVKYTGKFLTTDSVFQANSYSFQLGKLAAIRGWDEGIPMFRQGGKGTLYIPGFLAYGKNPPPGSPFKVNEPLVFDIEVLSVSDTAINPRQ